MSLGNLVMAGAAALAFLLGYSRQHPYFVPFCGVVWSIGYVISKPRAMRLLREDRYEYAITLFVLNSVGSTVIFGIGWGISLAVHSHG